MMKFLFNRNVVFTASVVAGFAAGGSLGVFSFLNMPILILIMTLSLAEIDFSEFKNMSKLVKPFLAGIGLNYFLVFFILISLGRLFGIEGKTWAGLVFTAATPPGLAIIPFTLVVKGDLFYSSVATFSASFAALVFTPWLATVFIGNDVVGFFDIFNLIAMLLVIPFILARIVRAIGGGDLARKIHGPVVNIGFGIIFAVILGINKELVLTDLISVAKLFFISVISVFCFAYAIRYVVFKRGIAEDTRKSIVLVATIKNSIFGATAGLALLGPEGALAGIVLTFVIFIYLIFIEKMVR